jgi:hypothetical protein
MKAIKSDNSKVSYKVGGKSFESKIIKETPEYYLVKHTVAVNKTSPTAERSLNRRVYK